MIKKLKRNSLLLFLTCTCVLAQDKWSLEDCVAYALEHNLVLKDFGYLKDSDRETYRQAIRNVLPTANVGSEYNISYGRSTDPFTNDVVNSDFFSNNYSMTAAMDVFQGFQKLNRIMASKYLFRAAKQDVQQQRYLLAFRVMQAYYDIKFYEGLLQNAKEQTEISQTNYDLVKKQIELGLKAGSDLYEAEATLLGDQLLVTQTANQLAAAKLGLIQEMNLEQMSDIELQPELEIGLRDMINISVDSVYGSAKTFMPSLQAELLRAKAAKKEVAAARGMLYPSISIFSGYGTGYYETTVDSLGVLIPFKNQIKDNASRYIGASIRIPITNGWSARSRVKQQKINHLRAKNNIAIQEQELFKIIQQLIQEYDALGVEVAQSTKKVALQELAFTIAQKKYEKGLINSLELFQAKTLFGSAQNENLQSRLRQQVNAKTIDFYSGLPVFAIDWSGAGQN